MPILVFEPVDVPLGFDLLQAPATNASTATTAIRRTARFMLPPFPIWEAPPLDTRSGSGRDFRLQPAPCRPYSGGWIVGKSSPGTGYHTRRHGAYCRRPSPRSAPPDPA